MICFRTTRMRSRNTRHITSVACPTPYGTIALIGCFCGYGCAWDAPVDANSDDATTEMAQARAARASGDLHGCIDDFLGQRPGHAGAKIVGLILGELDEVRPQRRENIQIQGHAIL